MTGLPLEAQILNKEKPSGVADGLSDWKRLVGEERTTQGLVATATAAVFPFHLDHPVVTTKGLVELRAVRSSLRRAELEVAFIGIFVAACVEPCVQVGIG